MMSMHPHQGPTDGGTKVEVVGLDFRYMPEYGVVPHCKFGNKIVRAYFDSTVRIYCYAPPNDKVGVSLSFSVSLNSVDWVTNEGFDFSYYQAPNMTNIVPDSGPATGGTEIFIFGNDIPNMNLTTYQSGDSMEFNCKFTPVHLRVAPKIIQAIYLNSTTIMCPAPGGWGEGDTMKLQVTFNGVDYDHSGFLFNYWSINDVYPRSGPSDGTGGDIIIEGHGFRNNSGV